MSPEHQRTAFEVMEDRIASGTDNERQTARADRKRDIKTCRDLTRRGGHLTPSVIEARARCGIPIGPEGDAQAQGATPRPR